MKTKLGAGHFFVAAAALLCGCSSTVKNYGLDDHFSGLEATSGSTSTPEQCTRTTDAVWVTGPSFRECIRYYPSQEFRKGVVRRAIVYMEGDFLSTSGAYPTYADLTPGKRIARAEREQNRGGTPYLVLGRPGTEGSSGSQHNRRTQYETLVVNAALDAIKSKYGIEEYGLVGQSGGGGLVAALIAERRDVLCAVPSSGATAVKHRVVAAGRTSDYTGKSMAEIWDPVEQLDRVHPMPGFRMFVTTDPTDAEVGYSSQAYYVREAQKRGLPVTHILVHGSGLSHHGTVGVGNRVVEDCMIGLSTSYIFKTYSGVANDYPDMEGLARKAQAQRSLEIQSQEPTQAGSK
ncbi:hypothetical protein [Herbaspirillum robiniae]|uniref:Alpha/beta hydrolase n=1 Tax=Herbaspirillum robiniae TaxID=2014887 RepID=A0A246WMB5_9BURK|nr:hypothetical protein [Herbaspirillum robiniae]OWY27402.1 hypothetical protein CEJ42_20375 [Herbaspirillum robiniae]